MPVIVEKKAETRPMPIRKASKRQLKIGYLKKSTVLTYLKKSTVLTYLCELLKSEIVVNNIKKVICARSI
ncbi:hypothetical protein CO053_02730 [Candidatus Shapirobacteria bacterium CG_4_9_14_0_2_um_filter_40_11]|uniref:Uncharacterized protein n=1 Tax=Candidatus Shapirobacteria bacterium CG_4_9_14_0_2_um_filter_40_11 TaxID=1974876 RepID=A0A2M8EUK5_9BACT|nr:MAG: hypothetical protein CO053_02730 [Candidatus Shapirobacteria bacterium CG_4_9_14_0_2_um_filter_40_11]